MNTVKPRVLYIENRFQPAWVHLHARVQLVWYTTFDRRAKESWTWGAILSHISIERVEMFWISFLL